MRPTRSSRQADRHGHTRQRSMSRARTGPGGGVSPILLIFGCQKAERALTLITFFDHTPRSINPDPPQSGPVFVIVVHEERERRICLQILEGRASIWAWRLPRSTRCGRAGRSNTGRCAVERRRSPWPDARPVRRPVVAALYRDPRHPTLRGLTDTVEALTQVARLSPGE